MTCCTARTSVLIRGLDDSHQLLVGLRQIPAAMTSWHLCTAVIPRRTITGLRVRGQVWRRHDGRHWLNKKLIA